ncbi:Ankyrin repeat-containing protein isoform 1, partial [Cladophialophora immunda]
EEIYNIPQVCVAAQRVPFRDDVHSRFCDPSAPTHCAVTAGHREVARLLLECDPTIKELAQNDRCRAIHIAAERGHIQIVLMLLDHNASTLFSGRFGTALHYAAREGNAGVCELL